MRKTFLATIMSLAVFLVLSTGMVLAQGGTSNSQNGNAGGTSNTQGVSFKIPNPIPHNNLIDLLKTVIDEIILPLGGMIAVFMFIYTGFKFVTARGDSKAIGEAKTALLYTAIGTAILLGSWAIATVIINTVGKITN
jgi:hypothetical protein